MVHGLSWVNMGVLHHKYAKTPRTANSGRVQSQLLNSIGYAPYDMRHIICPVKISFFIICIKFYVIYKAFPSYISFNTSASSILTTITTIQQCLFHLSYTRLNLFIKYYWNFYKLSLYQKPNPNLYPSSLLVTLFLKFPEESLLS